MWSIPDGTKSKFNGREVNHVRRHCNLDTEGRVQPVGMPMNRYERTLVLLLRLDGIIMLAALLPSMMPLAWMQATHRYLGMGELPDGPIIGYLTRSLSLMYAMHGAILLFLSLDVRRFLPVVKYVAVLTILFGLWLIGLDVFVGMPSFWTASEGPSLFILYCVVVWLTGRVQTERK